MVNLSGSSPTQLWNIRKGASLHTEKHLHIPFLLFLVLLCTNILAGQEGSPHLWDMNKQTLVQPEPRRFQAPVLGKQLQRDRFRLEDNWRTEVTATPVTATTLPAASFGAQRSHKSHQIHPRGRRSQLGSKGEPSAPIKQARPERDSNGRRNGDIGQGRIYRSGTDGPAAGGIQKKHS